MLRRLFLLAMPMAFVFPAQCEVPKQLFILGDDGRAGMSVPSVKLTVPAAQVASIFSFERDKGGTAASDVKAGLDLLRRRLEGYPKMEAFAGVVRLSRPGSWKARGSAAEMVVVARLGTNGYADVYEAAAAMNALFDETSKAAKARVLMSPPRLSLGDPEKWRPELIKAIAADADAVRQAIGPKTKIILTGLDNSVRVTEADDAHLDLTLPYGLSVESSN